MGCALASRLGPSTATPCPPTPCPAVAGGSVPAGMGCGLIAQRGRAVEAHHPLAREPGQRPVVYGEALRAPGTAASQHGSGPVAHRGLPGRRDERALRPGAVGGENGPVGWAQAPPSRRFMLGERVILTSRIPANAQDHAFCFECGAFFHSGSLRVPQCSRCGSSFVQYLRGPGHDWIASDSSAGVQYSFDDRLDDSVSASLEETPVQKTPTQGSVLRSLPSELLSEVDAQERSKLDTSDPRCHCAICREGFALGDVLRKMPCGHEFHNGCIVPWLRSNNTCPVCRLRLPEAETEEEEDDDSMLRVPKGGLDRVWEASDTAAEGVVPT
mmetsp:Transcript_54504/g.118021  ORF Transcript_54504/g.118021 Transcript_54504/m.118021 type:complete len:328 (+) Transcript_54504:93-1076(+)